jgi:hypothetical protein
MIHTKVSPAIVQGTIFYNGKNLPHSPRHRLKTAGQRADRHYGRKSADGAFFGAGYNFLYQPQIAQKILPFIEFDSIVNSVAALISFIHPADSLFGSSVLIERFI